MLKIPFRHAAMAGLAAVSLQAGAAASETTTFAVTIKNVATPETLELPDGSTAAAPIAPGAYAIVADGVQPFELNRPAGTGGLEHLAEDGNAEAFIAHLRGTKGVREAGMFVPGQVFEVTAGPGERLVFATMFVQSNDLFLAPDPQGIALFDAAKPPSSGDATSEVRLWDAGTETNEAPGAGPNQAPRQKATNTGPEEHGVIRQVHDGFTYPDVADVIQVTVEAR